MKKALQILGGLFLALVLLVASFIGYAAYRGEGLDASSKAYVEANVPPIISTWSKDALLKRSSPELLKLLHEHSGQVDRLFQKLSRLGPMRSFGHIQGESHVLYTTQNGTVTTAFYVGTAQFDKGEARITVRLIRLSGHWQFLLFRVHSPLLLR